jgi:hypothetical protein
VETHRETEQESPAAVARPAIESPNWMLVLVCGVVALTALWEAVGAARSVPRAWLDVAGYVALTVSAGLFAVQTALTPRRPQIGNLLQTPAVYLALAGVFMLLMSQSSGRRL